MALPKLDNSQGNNSWTAELTNEFTNAIIPMAMPRYFIGYNSESKTHITGPRENAKQAINPKIPINTRAALIFVAASRMVPSFLP